MNAISENCPLIPDSDTVAGQEMGRFGCRLETFINRGALKKMVRVFAVAVWAVAVGCGQSAASGEGVNLLGAPDVHLNFEHCENCIVLPDEDPGYAVTVVRIELAGD